MPTPRSHGGAELEKLPLNLPGFKGLNTQIDGALLGNEWATVLKNTVIDNGNRVSSRKGWRGITTDQSNSGIWYYTQLFEHVFETGATMLVAVTGDSPIFTKVSLDGGVNWVNSGFVQERYPQFVSFKGDCYVFQKGGPVLKYNPSIVAFEDFTPAYIADSNNVALSAFGRLWAVASSGYELQYSALLDEDDWDYIDPTSSAGVFDLRNVWKNTDRIVALAEFNGSLVVFGEQNILIWSDGQGSEVGLNPLNMYIADTLPNIGCVARDSVAGVDGDLWWLSDTGLMSLTRLITQKSSPMQNLSFNVQEDVQRQIAATDRDVIKGVYSPEERFYLLSMPSGEFKETGVAYCFDTRSRLEDGSTRCVGVWDMVPTAMTHTRDNRLLMSLKEACPLSVDSDWPNTGVGSYAGYSSPIPYPDSPITPYEIAYESAWNNYESPYIKIPKRIRAIVYTGAQSDITLGISYDFSLERFQEYDVFTDSVFTGGQFSSLTDLEPSLFNVALFSGNVGPAYATVPGIGGTGEYVKISVDATISGFPVALQEISLYLKQGRLI